MTGRRMRRIGSTYRGGAPAEEMGPPSETPKIYPCNSGKPSPQAATTPRKYRKKPEVVEAMQWDGTAISATRILEWGFSGLGTATYDYSKPEQQRLRIRTLEGSLYASPGDWIIRGIAGDFYPCKPEIFANTYDPVEDGDS